jgi:hypothetical protein
MKGTLWIDPRAGISGDKFAAALIGLGAPEQEMIQVIKSSAEKFGMLDAHTHIEFLPDETLAYRILPPWSSKSRSLWKMLLLLWKTPCPGQA